MALAKYDLEESIMVSCCFWGGGFVFKSGINLIDKIINFKTRYS